MAETFDSLKNQIAELQQKCADLTSSNQDLKNRLAELNSLYLISLTLTRTLDLPEILKSIRSLFQKKLKVDFFGIFILDENLSSLCLQSHFGLARKIEELPPVKFGEDILGEALASEQTIYIPDISQANHYQFFKTTQMTGSFLAIPILIRKNHPLGILSLQRRNIDAFTIEEREFFKRIALELAKVVDKSLLFQHTKELSITDDLTGLYNRRYFNQRFEREVLRAKRYRRPLSILLVDIDYFKNYNDINGHLLGDEVLKKVAYLIESNLRKADIVARYGGEEFVIILPEIDKVHADQVAEKLRRTIELRHFPKEQYQPNKNLTISIGLATLPEDSTNPRELLEFADRALYRAKEEGRNRVVAYHAAMMPYNSSNILHLEPKTMAIAK